MDCRMSDCFWQGQGLPIYSSDSSITNSWKTPYLVFDYPWKVNGLCTRSAWRDWKKEHAIYYLSKKFTDYESKYLAVEKMCCALAWTAQKLRQYLLYHTTWLISKLDPIKYIFEKPSFSGRIEDGKSYCQNTTFNTYLRKQLKEAPLQNSSQTELKKSISQWSLNF